MLRSIPLYSFLTTCFLQRSRVITLREVHLKRDNPSYSNLDVFSVTENRKDIPPAFEAASGACIGCFLSSVAFFWALCVGFSVGQRSVWIELPD